MGAVESQVFAAAGKPIAGRGEQVDVCAPGEDVLSTYLDAGYAKLSGTSMATPFVIPVIAMGKIPVTEFSRVMTRFVKTC